MFYRSLLPRVKGSYLSFETSSISLHCERIVPLKEKKLLLLLEEQKNHVLSDPRSELNMQELRVESADRVLNESSLQLH